jgi:predicted DNA-binding mobile mystery protein A
MTTQSKRFQQLQFQQVDSALSTWRGARLPARPPTGWARTVRETLGIPAAAQAKQLGITTSGLQKLELAEANQVITLASLRKLAEALGCELQYALVPRQPLAQQLQDRAKEVAAQQLAPVAHTMALEDQAVHGPARQLQRDLLAQELLAGPRRNLWK